MEAVSVRIEKVVSGGDGLARIDGRVVFVPGTLPGELVNIADIQWKRDFGRAGTVRVLEAHGERRNPPCIHYGRCGGCDAQYASPELQVSIKEAMVRDAWERLARQSPPPLRSWTGPIWAYRHRMQVHPDGQGRWGLKEGAGSAVVTVPGCPVAHPALREVLEEPCPPGAVRTVVFADPEGRVWRSDRHTEASLTLEGQTLHFAAASFFQSNLAQLSSLAAIFRDLSPASDSYHLLDLYGGAGTMTALWGPRYARAILVERDGNNVALARKNLPADRVEFHALDVEAWHRGPGKKRKVQVALVDPPRGGLDPASLRWLCQEPVELLVYVSCNPVTQARDAQALAAAGYRFETLHLLDFYPQTWHMETCLVARGPRP